MKRIVRLTESDLVRLVKRVIKEQTSADTIQVTIKPRPVFATCKMPFKLINPSTNPKINLTHNESRNAEGPTISTEFNITVTFPTLEKNAQNQPMITKIEAMKRELSNPQSAERIFLERPQGSPGLAMRDLTRFKAQIPGMEITGVGTVNYSTDIIAATFRRDEGCMRYDAVITADDIVNYKGWLNGDTPMTDRR